MRRLGLSALMICILGAGSVRAAQWTNEGGIQTGSGLLSYHESGAGNGGARHTLWTVSGDIQASLSGPGSGPFTAIRLFYGTDLPGEEHWKDPTQMNHLSVRIFSPELRAGYRLSDASIARWSVDPYVFLAFRWQWFSRSDFVVGGVPLTFGNVDETFRLPEGGGGVKGRLALNDGITLYLGGHYGRIFEGKVINDLFPDFKLATEGNHLHGEGGLSFRIDRGTSIAVGYSYDQILLKGTEFEFVPPFFLVAFPNSKTKMSYGYLRLTQMF